MRMKSCLVVVLSILVMACGGGGGGSNASGSTPALPAPDTLTVAESGVDQITLSWLPPNVSFNGYELEGRIGTDAFQKLHQGLIPNTYTGLILNFLPTAPDNTTYAFRLRAVQGTNFSPYSNVASYMRGPNAPGQPTATYDWGSATVHLAWDRNTSGSDGLRIERAECTQYGSITGTWTDLPIADPLASAYADTSASRDLYYAYRITNLAGTRVSQPSLASSPVYTGLAPISWMSAYFDSAQGGVLISWGSTTPIQADGVRLERCDSDASGIPLGNWTDVATPSGYLTTFLDKNIQEGGRYSYRVSALYGTTATSPCTMPGSVSIPMLPPVNLQVSARAGGLQLVWQNQSSIASEVVIRRLPYSGAYSDIAILSPSTASYLDPVTTLGYYTYTVVAKNGTQEAPSSSVTAATLNPPGSLALAATKLDLPPASDAALRPSGSWAFASTSPLGILSNNDSWPATFPGDAGRWADPLVQVDRLGWPHMVYATASTYGTASSLVHRWYDGTAWRSEILASATIPSTSANQGWTYRLDSTGTPHVILDHVTADQPYGGATASLSYVHKVNGAWVEESLASLTPSVYNVGSFHLSLDDSDSPHILLGNWSTAIDYVRTGPGAWSSTSIPAASISAGWYDYLDGLWIDSNNGWIFYQSYSSGGSALSVIQMKNGAWLSPQVLEPQAFSDYMNAGRCALSPDRSRIAILASTTLGFKVYHQAVDGWHTTLLAAPGDAWMSTMRVGFDGNQKLHLLLSAGAGYTDHHE